MKKIGLYFGSFNPVHVGHLIIAQTLYNTGEFDEVQLVVSPHNPLKAPTELAAPEHRLNMVNLALRNHEHISSNGVELELPQPSFTIDTLLKLEAQNPKTEFTIIMGYDSIESITKWKAYEVLLANYPIRVFPRNGSAELPFFQHQTKSLKRVEAPFIGISSTQIRAMIRMGLDIDFYTPSEVVKYIKHHHLYTV